MKNITVSVPDEIYIDARVWAARRGISVSAMVKLFLDHFSDDPEGIVEILKNYPLFPLACSRERSERLLPPQVPSPPYVL